MRNLCYKFYFIRSYVCKIDRLMHCPLYRSSSTPIIGSLTTCTLSAADIAFCYRRTVLQAGLGTASCQQSQPYMKWPCITEPAPPRSYCAGLCRLDMVSRTPLLLSSPLVVSFSTELKDKNLSHFQSLCMIVEHTASNLTAIEKANQKYQFNKMNTNKYTNILILYIVYRVFQEESSTLKSTYNKGVYLEKTIFLFVCLFLCISILH